MVLSLVQLVMGYVAEGCPADNFFLDFSKKAPEIRGNLLVWIENWIVGTRYGVFTNDRTI